jgi:tetratricopeptide (TPR) repeat protein
MDSLQRAAAVLENAIRLYPENGDLHLALGETYEKGQRWEDAIASFRKAVAFETGNTEYLFGLASCLERSGRFDESAAVFEDLLKTDPDDGLALNYLGYMLADRGIRLEEALALVARALEIEPDNGAFLDSMGWVLYRLGDYAQAEQYLDKAVQLGVNGDEESAVIFDHVGDVAEALGKLGKAREYWDKSLERDKTNERVREKLERIGGKQPNDLE